MNLLCFADLHADMQALRVLEKKALEADVIVCAGDFTVFESKLNAVLKRLNSIGKPVALVPGNHETPRVVEARCRTLRNVIYLHMKTQEWNGIIFAGHGSGGFTERDKSFEKWTAKLSFPKGTKLVFITHQPPFNTTLDYIWDHHGSKSYREFIRKFKPLLAVSGHLHETQGMEDRIGRTRCINPGPKGMLVSL